MSDVLPRYFTPAEANAVLPEVVERLARIAEQVKRARELGATAASPDGTEHGARAELEDLKREVEAHLDWIHEAGVHIKGLDPPLLDFPALRHGQEVYLCWREGETTIEHWHPIHTGIAGRQPLDPSALGMWEWCN